MDSDEYLHEKMENGAQVLKLVQIRQPQYSMFGPSVASTGYETGNSGILNRIRLIGTHLLQKLDLALGTMPLVDAKM